MRHHSILPVFGSNSSSLRAAPTEEQQCSYMPVIQGSQLSSPFAAPAAVSGQQRGCTGSSPYSVGASVATWPAHAGDVAQHHGGSSSSSRAPGLSSFGHACFEVWIAMELCDGGTLTEQLQSGFHCFPGSRQVDMVSCAGR